MTTQFSNEQHALYRLNMKYIRMLANFFCIYYEVVKPLRKKFSYLVAISLLTSHETYRFSMCLSNEGRKACTLACRVSELEAALQK